MHAECGHRHHADNQGRSGTGEQTQRQKQTADHFNQSSQQSERGGQAELGFKELAGCFQAVAAKSPKKLLSAMGNEQQAGRHTHQGFT